MPMPHKMAFGIEQELLVMKVADELKWQATYQEILAEAERRNGASLGEIGSYICDYVLSKAKP